MEGNHPAAGNRRQGSGYVELSLAVLLSQHNEITAVDILPEKVEKINRFTSPIQDDYIEKYLS